jgi:hypothetical protein
MSWIQTFTGQAFDPFTPDLATIHYKDIAHALAHQCRFTGHTNEFYSIAQHSVIVATLVPQPLQLAALLHDASEAYLCDIARPIKQQPEMQFYRDAELLLERMINARFGCQPTAEGAQQIKHIDYCVLLAEKRDLLGPCAHPWEEAPAGVQALPLYHIKPWSAAEAETSWLNCFHLLFKGQL